MQRSVILITPIVHHTKKIDVEERNRFYTPSNRGEVKKVMYLLRGLGGKVFLLAKGGSKTFDPKIFNCNVTCKCASEWFILTKKQRNKHTNKQTNKQTHKQTNKNKTKTKQNKTKQNKIKQKQNKTKTRKTKQNKTKKTAKLVLVNLKCFTY